MRIVEGPTGTGPATWPRGQRATWHRANGHMAVGHLSRLRPQRWGVGAKSIVDSIRQGAGPAPRERPPAAAATHGGDVGDASAAAHASVGQLAARLAVDQVPSRACRFESCPMHLEGPADGRRRQPSRKRKAHTGVRVRSSLPPPGSVGPAGVDARLSSGRSRVRVPYGARSAVVAAGCQSGLSIRAARVRSPSTAHARAPMV